MSDAQDVVGTRWTSGETLESPFAEAFSEPEAPSSPTAGWNTESSPFAESWEDHFAGDDTAQRVAEALAELRDENFDESLAALAEDLERDISERFAGEDGAYGAERQRYGEARLSEVRYEAERYLDSLSEGLAGMDLGALGEDTLAEMLDRFDPQSTELGPVGEEFIGSLIRKAKNVVGKVVSVAKKVGSLASPLLAPVLNKLKRLINPLLKRVLSFAVGRLPAPLRPAARQLASKIKLEASEEEDESDGVSPTNLADPQTLAAEFDVALAEAIVSPGAESFENEESEDHEGEYEEGRLIELARARGALIDRLAEARDGEDLTPAVEQFVPALLGAVRLGINLVGRPKVVGFLAGYLGKVIRRWVSPEMAKALSNAIVDTGLKLMTLEAEDGTAGERESHAAPVALAAVIEDTVRRLAEHEEFVFESEELLQLATAEAFGEAIATHFPQDLVRVDLQRAPSLGGTFVARRPRHTRTYRKYSRVPDVDLTAQIADSIPTFGGSTLGEVLRASGTAFPMKARMHIYQAAPGTSLAAIGRFDRAARGGKASFHPLTATAAGMLLREPRLGGAVPSRFMRSPGRIAAGQRVYVLQPVGAPLTTRARPTKAHIRSDYLKGLVTISLFFSEAEAQQIVQSIRKGEGAPPLLRALVAASSHIGLRLPAKAVRREDNEDQEDHEDFAPHLGKLMPTAIRHKIRRRLAAWILPALGQWARTGGESFARAAGHPDEGVTVRVHVQAPFLKEIGKLAQSGGLGAVAKLLKGVRTKPAIDISVNPGTKRS